MFPLFRSLLFRSQLHLKNVFFFFSESLLDGIECLPNGSVCDLVQLVLIPQYTSNRTISNSASSATQYSTTTRASTDLFASSRQKTKYNTRVLFIAFDRVFDVLLKKENLESEESSTCFYSGYLSGKKHSTKAHLNLCGGVVRPGNPYTGEGGPPLVESSINFKLRCSKKKRKYIFIKTTFLKLIND